MAPRLVATVGLHGSASTCVFNVVRELMIAAVGADNVLATFADDVSGLPPPLRPESRHVVLKSHCGSPSWQWLVALTAAPVLLSVRDPRDSVVSIMERFGVTLEQAVRDVAADCHLAWLCADAGSEPLRFENRFYDDDGFASRTAARLELDVPEDVCREIGRRYSTGSMRAFAAALDDMPGERVVRFGQMQYDQVTQIHRTHIGDARIGKWREYFPPPERDRLTQTFAPVLEKFGYAA